MTIAIDTSAIFAFLASEAEAPRIGRLLLEDSIVISAATLTETNIVVFRRLGLDGKRRLDALIAGAEFEVAVFDQAHSEEAFIAHVRYGRGSGHKANLNMGDCFSYALAKSRNLPLLYKGNDFVHTDIEPALKPA
ncbi:type II toxin-antitoxin system VapC family toxin [Mesorhizobium sp. SB112]|uniref:type II toxin-antitoxin system VapC family toxin n=1 Tax=Mesorhizobium sp. SB112 TaxID=3151853 RepID=UPI00326499EA